MGFGQSANLFMPQRIRMHPEVLGIKPIAA
jgi:hypothetical protein